MIEKKYLKNDGEVIQALKEGHVLKVENGGEGYIYMQDGFIVKNNNSGYHINYTINECDKPYYFIENPLKIEVGKFYKTRNGIKARCFFADSFRFFKFTIDGLSDVFKTNIKGEHLIPGRFENEEMPNDIVDYWEEK